MSGDQHAPGCDWADADHFRQHPCGQKPEPPGSPCRWCGASVPMNGDPCPSCWTPVSANHADAKALLALGGLSLNVEASR